MANQWYYRMFGQDFGPVGIDELKQLAELGSISSGDEVRPANSSNWVAADSVSELGLSGANSASPKQLVAEPAPTFSTPAGADDWYCMIHGQELGPLTFDEVLEFAERGQFDANDDVKLGESGKWRKVGSIGRLVAVLPFHEPQAPEPKPPEKVAPPVPAPAVKVVAVAAPPPPPKPNPELIAANNAVVQAETALAAADQTAKMLVSWALARNVDPTWWAWYGGAEYGPVGFTQIFEWALTGRFQLSDFVKNGFHGHYGPASNVPGLASAVSIMSQAIETLKAAQAAAAAIAATQPPLLAPAVSAPVAPVPAPAAPPSTAVATPAEAPKPAAPVAKSNPEITPPNPAPAAVTETKAEEPAKPAVAAPAPTSSFVSSPTPSAYSSSSSFATSSPRPMPSAPRPPVKSSSGGGFSTDGIVEILKSPMFLGVIAVILLVVGFFYLPGGYGKDIERYRNIKQLLDDVRTARSGSKDFEPLKTRAKKLSDDYIKELKPDANNNYPVKQALYWAVRDELPKMMAGDLAKESNPEKNLELRLKDAATRMGIK